MEDASKIMADTISDEDKKALQLIEEITINADEIQTRVLGEILSRSAHAEYLQRNGLNGRIDRETFKNIMPVVTYEDLLPDINRIASGDTSPILCGQLISQLFTSSATSGGEMKLIPMTEDEIVRRSSYHSLARPVINQYVTGLNRGKVMSFMFIRSGALTPGGIVAHTILTGYYRSSIFQNRPTSDTSACFTSPDEIILCLDSYQSMYSQMLCGLVQNQQVVQVGAVFASGLIRAIQFLEKHWTILCNDIRFGTINPEIVTDPSVKEAVSKILEKPNPELANFIENECSKDCFSWKGIIPRLWPNAKYVEGIITGTMSHYIPTLEYYANGLPLVSTSYASSECSFGINLKPLCQPSEVSYTFIPNLAYFEFLPISMPESSFNEHEKDEHQKQDHELIDLVNVKLGQEYEVVVTTYCGLYRYKLGDVVRVSGFKNKAPQFSFVRRRNVVLSIDFDKTDEVDLQNAVQNAVNYHLMPLDVSLLDYTSYADMSIIPGHYVLYWELRDLDHGATLSLIRPSVLEDCCFTIEETLSSSYRLSRVTDKSIGPLEIKIVEAGTYDLLMDYAISRGASISQYKTPRCVKTTPMVEIMNSRVVSSYFSQKCPQYVAGHKQWDVQANQKIQN